MTDLSGMFRVFNRRPSDKREVKLTVFTLAAVSTLPTRDFTSTTGSSQLAGFAGLEYQRVQLVPKFVAREGQSGPLVKAWRVAGVGLAHSFWPCVRYHLVCYERA